MTRELLTRVKTSTGNRSFVAAAEHGGVTLSIFYQPARALTEQKALQKQQKLNNDNRPEKNNENTTNETNAR